LHSGNTVRCNVSMSDVTGPPDGVGAMVGMFGLINESFDHNLVSVENNGSDEKIFQLTAWYGDNVRFDDNVVFAGPNVSPFLLDPNCWGGLCSGTNLQMSSNVYRFANDPQPFSWNQTVYNSIAEWQAATGLDLDSQFIVGPFQLPPPLEQFKTQPLTPDMFGQLIPGCEAIPN
jgi:hypothetical protein